MWFLSDAKIIGNSLQISTWVCLHIWEVPFHSNLFWSWISSQLTRVDITSTSSLKHTSNVVFLSFHDLMLESESSCSDNIFVIENNIKGVLFSTNTVVLATFRVNVNLDEFLHSLVEIKSGSILASTRFGPQLVWLDEVLENVGP